MIRVWGFSGISCFNLDKCWNHSSWIESYKYTTVIQHIYIIGIFYTYMYRRQSWYWQIVKHWFLVAWNGIKMRCSNTVFMFTKETWSKIKVTFLVLRYHFTLFYVKYCSVLEYWQYKNCITTSYFYAIKSEQKSGLSYLSISTLSTIQGISEKEVCI